MLDLSFPFPPPLNNSVFLKYGIKERRINEAYRSSVVDPEEG